MRKTISESQVREAWTRLAPPQSQITLAGLTSTDLAGIWGCSETTARWRVRALLRGQIIRLIGQRPGSSGARAYDIVEKVRR